MSQLKELSFDDMTLVVEVHRLNSIREVARRLQLEPSHVSRRIKDIEQKIGKKLFERSTKGLFLTPDGEDFTRFCERSLFIFDEFESSTSSFPQRKKKDLTFGSTSFLNNHLVSTIASELMENGLIENARLLDFSPDQFTSLGLKSGFEAGVHIGEIDWPKTWSSLNVGTIRWALFARKSHPILANPSLEAILDLPFIIPTYWTPDGLHRGNDQFPVPVSKRKVGSETATADAALHLLKKTNQIAFLPEVVANYSIKLGEVERVPCPEVLPSVSRPLFLSVRSDSVSKIIFQFMVKTIQAELEKLTIS